MRVDLSAEAIRLGRVLVELMPDEPEAVGLLALMLLTDARRPARVAPDGSMVRLADQDRSRWDRDLIAEGHDLVRACLRRNQPGPFQIQAAIAAVHADAPTADATDWAQIVALYDQLHAQRPNAVVAHEPGHRDRRAARAGRRPGRPRRARRRPAGRATSPTTPHAPTCWPEPGAPARRSTAYDRAIELTTNVAERQFLSEQLTNVRRARCG